MTVKAKKSRESSTDVELDLSASELKSLAMKMDGILLIKHLS